MTDGSPSRRQIVLATGLALIPAMLRAAPSPAHWQSFTIRDGGIVLPITLHRTPTNGLLDNGANKTVVDAALAARAGLRPDAPLEMHGWTNSVHGDTAAVDVTIGDFRVRVEAFLIAFGASGPPQPAVLGRDLFRDQVIELDFGRQRLRIMPRAAFRAPRGSEEVTTPTGRPGGDERPGDYPNLIRARLEGHPVDAWLDLGSDEPLHVSRPLADRLGLLRGRPTSLGARGDVGGLRTTPIFTCASFELGGATLHDIPAEVFDSTDETVVLGLELISRFDVALDTQLARLWVTPRPAALSGPFAKDRTGLSLLPDPAGLKVVFVAPGSPAAAGAWRAGDIIVAVDGVPVSRAGAAWRRGAPGEVHRFGLESGETRSLTQADYY
jgi:predicted aspartyl protease